MDWIKTVLALFANAAISIWSRVATTINLIINEMPDDQVTILHDALEAANKVLAAGGSAADALNAAETTWLGEEKTELDKVGRQLLGAWIDATTAKMGNQT
jgi:hypothetical protein